MDAYIDVAHSCFSQQEAYEKTAKHPAPRYYVSPKQAFQVISPMVKGDFEKVELMQPNRRRMYYALFEEVQKLFEKREFEGKSLSYAMQFAVLRPAPEFFVGWKCVKRIRCWLKRGYYDEEGRVRPEKVSFYRT